MCDCQMHYSKHHANAVVGGGQAAARAAAEVLPLAAMAAAAAAEQQRALSLQARAHFRALGAEGAAPADEGPSAELQALQAALRHALSTHECRQTQSIQQNYENKRRVCETL